MMFTWKWAATQRFGVFYIPSILSLVLATSPSSRSSSWSWLGYPNLNHICQCNSIRIGAAFPAFAFAKTKVPWSQRFFVPRTRARSIVKTKRSRLAECFMGHLGVQKHGLHQLCSPTSESLSSGNMWKHDHGVIMEYFGPPKDVWCEELKTVLKSLKLQNVRRWVLARSRSLNPNINPQWQHIMDDNTGHGSRLMAQQILSFFVMCLFGTNLNSKPHPMRIAPILNPERYTTFHTTSVAIFYHFLFRQAALPSATFWVRWERPGASQPSPGCGSTTTWPQKNFIWEFTTQIESYWKLIHVDSLQEESGTKTTSSVSAPQSRELDLAENLDSSPEKDSKRDDREDSAMANSVLRPIWALSLASDSLETFSAMVLTIASFDSVLNIFDRIWGHGFIDWNIELPRLSQHLLFWTSKIGWFTSTVCRKSLIQASSTCQFSLSQSGINGVGVGSDETQGAHGCDDLMWYISELDLGVWPHSDAEAASRWSNISKQWSSQSLQIAKHEGTRYHTKNCQLWSPESPEAFQFATFGDSSFQ